MRLSEEECRRLLSAKYHAVFATVHARRGVDLVPVVFAEIDDTIVIPIDTTKEKRSPNLQRVRNLEADSRCSLLVEHWEEDWGRLWWVRVHGNASLLTDAAIEWESAVTALSLRYSQYRFPGSIAAVIEVRPVSLTGWRAG